MQPKSKAETLLNAKQPIGIACVKTGTSGSTVPVPLTPTGGRLVFSQEYSQTNLKPSADLIGDLKGLTY